jgi:signal transduction histidine kinase
MKIIPKLTVALVLGTSVILGVNGWLRVQREGRFFEAERVREHEMVGRSLQAAVAAIWKADGEAAALGAIDAASSRSRNIGIRWVALPQGGEHGGDLDPIALQALQGNEPVTARPGPRTSSLWKTYVPLDTGGVHRGVIELTEPPSSEGRFMRNAIVDTVAMALALVIISALLAFVMGQWLVGNPVRALSEKARRIGRGDFSGPVTLAQRDELADLAREMNAMCDRLATTLDQLRHADRLATVGKLASGVAHELGTPLNVVGARARMVAGGETNEDESREYARIIVTATDRMTKTISQLLQFARRTGPDRAPHDLRALTGAAVDLLRPLAKQARSQLVVAPDAGDATANVDAGQFQQVVTNLVMNAIQAMPEGGVVNLSLKRENVEPPADVHCPSGEYLCLSVHDDGEGIAQENLARIFEPFFTTKDVDQGTGLGLAVAYGIVKDHGGWIAVDSKVRQGATFSVFLAAGAA